MQSTLHVIPYHYALAGNTDMLPPHIADTISGLLSPLSSSYIADIQSGVQAFGYCTYEPTGNTYETNTHDDLLSALAHCDSFFPSGYVYTIGINPLNDEIYLMLYELRTE